MLGATVIDYFTHCFGPAEAVEHLKRRGTLCSLLYAN